ncbi:hypothetical protein GCM10027343_43660 [Noviherbaspirillum agri]
MGTAARSVALGAFCVGVLAACGGGSSSPKTDQQPSTGAPASGSSFTNPLELDPAPQFSTSSRAVTYDDCFPRFDDVELGDVVKSTVETYAQSEGIGSVDQTETVTEMTRTTFNGRDALIVKTDNPPYLRSDNVMVLGVEATALILHGGSIATSRKNYLNDATGTRTLTTNTPATMGDLSAGRSASPFLLGDAATHTYKMDYVNYLVPELNSSVDVAEKVTFIGVEEGTEVAAGKFDYTCVFRHELFSTINGKTVTSVQDYYTHKWSGVKALTYGAPRPLVYQIVSNSAIARRKAAP